MADRLSNRSGLFAIFWALTDTAGVNFLAHLYLSESSPASMIGNLLPDLAPGPTDPALDPGVRAGARNHRRVDAFTDTHPVFARSRSLFRERHGRFSAILTDVFYDHVLARDWSRYDDRPLDGFIDEAHDALTRRPDLMPAKMRVVIGRMVEQGWLRCYATPGGMSRVLGMMSRRFTERLGRPVDLACAVADLPGIGAALTEDFHMFFPQLIAYVRETPPKRPSSKVERAGPARHCPQLGAADRR